MSGMTPKQAYDERKRLRNENELRRQQRIAAKFDSDTEMEMQFTAILTSFERIASVLELWADQQEPAGRKALSEEGR
jgi:hypothetical protein